MHDPWTRDRPKETQYVEKPRCPRVLVIMPGCFSAQVENEWDAWVSYAMVCWRESLPKCLVDLKSFFKSHKPVRLYQDP